MMAWNGFQQARKAHSGFSDRWFIGPSGEFRELTRVFDPIYQPRQSADDGLGSRSTGFARARVEPLVALLDELGERRHVAGHEAWIVHL
jgi:hypothetical protein